MSELPLESLVLLVASAFAGGVASGLIGFGAGLVAMLIWLLFLPPVVAVPLIAICSLPGQLQSLRAVSLTLDWRRLTPLLGAALLGVPLGVWLLTRVDAQAFRLFIGGGLAAYAVWRLISRRWRGPPKRKAGPVSIGLVGFVSGFFGGFAGISAPMVSLWASLQGWGKDEQRAIYQPLMIWIATVMIANFALRGLLTWEVLQLAMLGIPAIMLGTLFGVAIYRRLNDVQFETVILLVILFSGLNLTLRSL